MRRRPLATLPTAQRSVVSHLPSLSTAVRFIHKNVYTFIYVYIVCALCRAKQTLITRMFNVKILLTERKEKRRSKKKNIPIKYVWNILHICVYKLEWRTSWNERCGRHSHGWSRMRKRDELSSFSNPCAPIQLHSESSSVPTAAAALLLMERIFDFFYLMRWRSFSHFLSLTRLLARLLACSYSLLLCCCFCFVSSLEQPYTILAL